MIIVTVDTRRTQVDMDRDRKVRMLGRFYECVFCLMDQSSAGFTQGPGKWGVFVGGCTSSQGSGYYAEWLVTDLGATLGRLHGDRVRLPALFPLHHAILNCVVYPAFLRSAQLFCIFPPQQAAAGLILKAPARVSGQRAFRDFSLLARDFKLLCFSLEPSGQSLFNVMAVYFNKSHRFGQFKFVFSVVQSDVEHSRFRWSWWECGGAATQMLSINGSSLISIKVALLLALVALHSPTSRPFIESFPFLPLLITLLAFAALQTVKRCIRGPHPRSK